MEKLEINNEILTLKREMKIGRVHLLRRLIAQVKKLENAKGTDEQRTKKKQKAERWMQQVKVLQKANLDSLARKAMVSEECWLKVISEPKSTLEERALARLLNLKKVQDFVTSFRKEHLEWKSWVPQLVEMWDEKKARRLSYKAKGAGPTGRCRPPEKMVRKQRSNVKGTVLPRGRTATSGATMEAPQMSTKVKGSVLVAAVDMTQLQGKQDDGQLRFAPADEGPRSDDDGATNAARESVKKRDPFFCGEGDDDDDDMEDDEEQGGLHGRPSARERFHRDDDDDDEGGSVRKSGRGFHGDGGGRFSRLPRGGRPFRGRGGGFGRGDGFKGRDGFRGDTRGRDGPVHPSWAAKQQQKVKLANLSAFQGKKITFD
ncbi:hypothetical protein HPB47_000642 [Ixodes persulcatus]|uniref:Uncharacterized protein n=1 Tax=Ixodes persulcatus TaxID=34615 RepID=A0AC60PSI2_IXOPE|nr:hypothetical protein HPB47_000642 [Ixodes persulcatus]